MKGLLCGLICDKKRNSRIPAGIFNSDDYRDASHEGIKTVSTDNTSDSSITAGSRDVCICIVTWNMNGQVDYEDIKMLVGSDRKYDLIVIGLQEVLDRVARGVVRAKIHFDYSRETSFGGLVN